MSEQFLSAIVVAIVEGFSEFLPVSSTGHIIIVGNLLGFSGRLADVFDVFVQFGAILSVLFLYPTKFAYFMTPDGWNWKKGFSVWHVAAGCVPCMGIAFFTYKYIKAYLFNPFTVAVGLFLGAILLFYAEHKAKNSELCDNLDEIGLKQCFYVGLFQILSLWPGFSRSGSTIAGGMLAGLSRKVSAAYTFIMAVPVMFAASCYDIFKNYHLFTREDWNILLVGFTVSGIVAYLSMTFFVRFVEKNSLNLFGYYRILLAVITLCYFYY